MADNGSELQTSTSEPEPAQAALSCHLCRKRKIKCDRILPSCLICIKNSQTCVYPQGPLKPGPKLGASRRQSKRTRSRSRSRSRSPARARRCSCANAPCPTNDKRGHSPVREAPAFQSDNSLIDDASRRTPTGGDSPAEQPPAEQHPAPSSLGPGFSPVMSLPTLSWIIHPTPEAARALDIAYAHPDMGRTYRAVGELTSIEKASCDALHTSLADTYHLIDLYFANMTAFSLFHRPSFTDKCLAIRHSTARHALLAAMFAFSARFRTSRIATQSTDAQIATLPTAEHFQELAQTLIATALKECADEAPSVELLQAIVLSTFAELVKGARGQSWRSVGVCVRMAYELELHLIDADKPGSGQLKADCDPEVWVREEERRRIWWTIWEFDVFVSTVRRSPTAIDWSQNETLLPVPDSSWFSTTPQGSCFLDTDPSVRWKSLQKCGNQSEKAWFIVVNSMMRNAQLLSTPKGLFEASSASRKRRQSSSNVPRSRHTLSADAGVNTTEDLAILSNSLSCFALSVPKHLRYRNEHLSFSSDPITGCHRQRDADIYSIHTMTQLARFMIHHRQFFGKAEGLGSIMPDLVYSGTGSADEPDLRYTGVPEERPWTRYLDAADNMVLLLRNSSPDHIQYVNPFLANTIWMAAAVLLVYRFLGPAKNERTVRLVESKYDLLHSTFTQFADWWNMSPALGEKLTYLQLRLHQLYGATEPSQGVVDTLTQNKSFPQQKSKAATQEKDEVHRNPFGMLEEQTVFPRLTTPDSLMQVSLDDANDQLGEMGNVDLSNPYDVSMDDLFNLKMSDNAELQTFLTDIFSTAAPGDRIVA